MPVKEKISKIIGNGLLVSTIFIATTVLIVLLSDVGHFNDPYFIWQLIFYFILIAGSYVCVKTVFRNFYEAHTFSLFILSLIFLLPLPKEWSNLISVFLLIVTILIIQLTVIFQENIKLWQLLIIYVSYLTLIIGKVEITNGKSLPLSIHYTLIGLGILAIILLICNIKFNLANMTKNIINRLIIKLNGLFSWIKNIVKSVDIYKSYPIVIYVLVGLILITEIFLIKFKFDIDLLKLLFQSNLTIYIMFITLPTIFIQLFIAKYKTKIREVFFDLHFIVYVIFGLLYFILFLFLYMNSNTQNICFIISIIYFCYSILFVTLKTVITFSVYIDPINLAGYFTKSNRKNKEQYDEYIVEFCEDILRERDYKSLGRIIDVWLEHIIRRKISEKPSQLGWLYVGIRTNINKEENLEILKLLFTRIEEYMELEPTQKNKQKLKILFDVISRYGGLYSESELEIIRLRQSLIDWASYIKIYYSEIYDFRRKLLFEIAQNKNIDKTKFNNYLKWVYNYYQNDQFSEDFFEVYIKYLAHLSSTIIGNIDAAKNISKETIIVLLNCWEGVLVDYTYYASLNNKSLSLQIKHNINQFYSDLHRNKTKISKKYRIDISRLLDFELKNNIGINKDLIINL